jgi:hypothetical protein
MQDLQECLCPAGPLQVIRILRAGLLMLERALARNTWMQGCLRMDARLFAPRWAPAGHPHFAGGAGAAGAGSEQLNARLFACEGCKTGCAPLGPCRSSPFCGRGWYC